jgi:hypothetical protein
MRETFSGCRRLNQISNDTSTSPLDEMRTTLWMGPRCRSIVDISLDYTTAQLAYFNRIVLMMSPPSNPPRRSLAATMWRYGR